jgi:hypothetical protein
LPKRLATVRELLGAARRPGGGVNDLHHDGIAIEPSERHRVLVARGGKTNRHLDGQAHGADLASLHRRRRAHRPGLTHDQRDGDRGGHRQR